MKLSTCLFFLCLTSLAFTKEEHVQIQCPVIGIDLGTTHSRVAIFRNGSVEIIPNELGHHITPSVVAFTDKERLVGEAAKNQEDSTRTVYDAKRLIGRRYNDREVQQDKKYLPFDIINKDNKTYIKTEVKGETKVYAPEEISAMVLSKMKEMVEAYIGTKVKNAVVTVPAYFNDAQRQATKYAGKIAGLNVVRIINEPTAAAIAYGLGLDKKDGEKNIMVFDLGGGTFDVSIFKIGKGVFEVISTSGDTHLGGEDFDQRTLDHFLKIIKRKHGKDLSNDRGAVQKLKKGVESAKRMLSSTNETKIEVEGLIEGQNFSETLTRSRFEELNYDLFRKTLEPVQTALKDAGLNKTQIDEIVLVGGSTRIPVVQKLIKDFFNGKEPSSSINPDEAVAYGAAVHGGILCGDESDETRGMILIERTPLTLGIEIVGGIMAEVLPRGTSIPAKKSRIFSTYQTNQETVTIQVFEGERPMTKDNYLLDKFDLTGIPRAYRGTPQIVVTFEVDIDNILFVSAVEKSTGKIEKLVINKGTLSQEEIAHMTAERDRIAKEKTDARNAFESYINFMMKAVFNSEKLADKLTDDEKDTIEKAVREAQKWLHDDDSKKENFEEQQKALEKICNPIISKAYEALKEAKVKQDIRERGELILSVGGALWLLTTVVYVVKMLKM